MINTKNSSPEQTTTSISAGTEEYVSYISGRGSGRDSSEACLSFMPLTLSGTPFSLGTRENLHDREETLSSEIHAYHCKQQNETSGEKEGLLEVNWNGVSRDTQRNRVVVDEKSKKGNCLLNFKYQQFEPDPQYPGDHTLDQIGPKEQHSLNRDNDRQADWEHHEGEPIIIKPERGYADSLDQTDQTTVRTTEYTYTITSKRGKEQALNPNAIKREQELDKKRHIYGD